MNYQKDIAEHTVGVANGNPIYNSKSEIKPDNSEKPKIGPQIRPPCEPEMSRNRAMDELQNCRSGDGRHQIGAMNAFPDRQAQNCT